MILLSANDTDADVVRGLDLGADDYVTKPFSLSVLRARVNTQLRKAVSTEASDSVIRLDKFSFDFDKMIFTGLKESEFTVCAYVGVPTAIGPRRGSYAYDVVLGSGALREAVGDTMVPLIAYRNLFRASIVERIREIG